MSTALLITFVLEILLMIGLPLAAVFWLKRKWALPLSIALAGAATFVGSQVLHIPANAALAAAFKMEAQPLIVQAIVLGLSAGIFEEVARYVVYRFWQTEVRSWQGAVFFGLGHGAVEAILTGLLVALTLANVMVITNAEDLAALELPEGTMAQVEDFLTTPLYLPALAVLERVMAITLHVGLSTLVALCFARKTIWPLLVAILWHALADAVAVYVNQQWGAIASEGALAIIALVSVGIIWWTRRSGNLPAIDEA
ncbi:MAG: YhfC family intramembrane metalloprotease [Anaerolineae bacterium]|nr:YhfC family intramembrane metalloprotease [Anaerolineae bacterium]